MLKNKPPEDEIYSSSSSETGLNVKRIDPPQLVAGNGGIGMRYVVFCVVPCGCGRWIEARCPSAMYLGKAR